MGSTTPTQEPRNALGMDFSAKTGGRRGRASGRRRGGRAHGGGGRCGGRRRRRGLRAATAQHEEHRQAGQAPHLPSAHTSRHRSPPYASVSSLRPGTRHHRHPSRGAPCHRLAVARSCLHRYRHRPRQELRRCAGPATPATSPGKRGIRAWAQKGPPRSVTPPVLCPLRHRTRYAPRDACRADTSPDRYLGDPATARGHLVRPSTTRGCGRRSERPH